MVVKCKECKFRADINPYSKGDCYNIVGNCENGNKFQPEKEKKTSICCSCIKLGDLMECPLYGYRKDINTCSAYGKRHICDDCKYRHEINPHKAGCYGIVGHCNNGNKWEPEEKKTKRILKCGKCKYRSELNIRGCHNVVGYCNPDFDKFEPEVIKEKISMNVVEDSDDYLEFYTTEKLSKKEDSRMVITNYFRSPGKFIMQIQSILDYCNQHKREYSFKIALVKGMPKIENVYEKHVPYETLEIKNPYYYGYKDEEAEWKIYKDFMEYFNLEIDIKRENHIWEEIMKDKKTIKKEVKKEMTVKSEIEIVKEKIEKMKTERKKRIKDSNLKEVMKYHYRDWHSDNIWKIKKDFIRYVKDEIWKGEDIIKSLKNFKMKGDRYLIDNLTELDSKKWDEFKPILALVESYYNKYKLYLEKKKLCYYTDCYKELATEKTCRICGNINPIEAKYCNSCGKTQPPT